MKIGQSLASNEFAVQSDMIVVQENINEIMSADGTSYDGIFVMNQAGMSIASFPEQMTGIDFSDRDYYIEVMKTGKQYISDVILSRASGNPIIMIATPIIKNDKVIGAIGQAVKLDALNTMREEFDLGETGYTTVTTNRNVKAIVIAHPIQEYVLEQTDVTDIEIVNKSMSGENQTLHFINTAGDKMFGASVILPLTN